ncbi:diheme cytochrome c-553 [Flavilitoribacter nigricans]|uniref:Diheme cytochrome c-553 n=1 Tax=Flavilitoribacter nigricans (strain ATCC 23147 / DSM 23189 / NBRC 102662 / NCIMB 1420 / SS-2) TaxID=1122177 RepID=A0A2D0N9W4_FLAN2|nr:diheme cytochrome c-553 [Flavilitoribacter nigricans]PHN05166.1 diheme cytochrome c-553 [Flavilitoribacter nigricans DSM 23189 = NBRC 102662]
MKKTKLLFLLLPVALLLVYCSDEPEQDDNSGEAVTVAETTGASSTEALIKRGEYLLEIMSCHDCHSPKQMGPNGPEIIPGKGLSGHPADMPYQAVAPSSLPEGAALFNATNTVTQGPWGITFSANITSDETGIGNWSEEQFRKAFTQGKSKGMDNTRPLLPPMPWFNFVNISDEDLHALFTYLKHTEPVKNVVPNPIPIDEL